MSIIKKIPSLFRPQVSSHFPRASGFTLIELLVAVAIFSMVMVISTGAVLAILDGNNKAQSLKSVMNNLNFALEGMARSIRVGTNYHCGDSGSIAQNSLPRNCTAGDTFFAFTSKDGDYIAYRLSNGQIERIVETGGPIGITAPEITIDRLRFYVLGATATDQLQPKLIMVVEGTAGSKLRTRSTFNLQTTVSQRLLDIQIGS